MMGLSKKKNDSMRLMRKKTALIAQSSPSRKIRKIRRKKNLTITITVPIVWSSDELHHLNDLTQAHKNDWRKIKKKLNMKHRNNRSISTIKCRSNTTHPSGNKLPNVIEKKMTKKMTKNEVIYQIMNDNSYWDQLIHFTLIGHYMSSKPFKTSKWNLELITLTHNGIPLDNSTVFMTSHVPKSDLLIKDQFPDKLYNITIMTFDHISSNSEHVKRLKMSNTSYYVRGDTYRMYIFPSSFDFIGKDIKDTWLTPLIAIYFEK